MRLLRILTAGHIAHLTDRMKQKQKIASTHRAENFLWPHITPCSYITHVQFKS